MKEMRRIYTLLICLLTAMVLTAQTSYEVVKYDEEDGVPSGHTTQMLQDKHGFMWFSTWNGLCRFDGYDFQTFKPQVGDGCHMSTDRIRSISLRPNGEIVCRVEEDEYYLFDTHTYQFRDVTEDEKQQAVDDIKNYRQSKSLVKDTTDHRTSFAFDDRQGNRWVLTGGSISMHRPLMQHTQRLDIAPADEVKCLFKDNKNRYWLTTRKDAAVRIYTADMHLLGFLASDGTIRKSYTTFGAPIYCMYQTADGTLWLGSKPKGLFRLKESGEGRFTVSQPQQMKGLHVYNIKEDRFGRLWIATMRNGLFYSTDYQQGEPHFLTPKGYPKECCQRVRYIHITGNNLLIAATTEGLVVAKLESQADNIHFLRHQRESDRATSMSSSATMDVIENGHGQLMVSTESGGVNVVEESELLKPQAVFHHLNTATHQLPNDIALSLALMDDGRTIVVSSHLVTLLDTLGHSRVLDARFFNANYRFADARPLHFGNGQWLFGLKDGAFTTSTDQMFSKSYCPPLVLTNIEVRGEKKEDSGTWNAETLDTLTLQPNERSVTVHFAALDFSAPERINYAFRLLDEQENDSVQWNYIGRDRSATLLDMEPGTYRLEIRSTNADGEWQQNTRVLTIIVKPTFWEAWYGQLLILLLIIGVVAIVVYTLLYIRRIKRQQRETLEKYLALLEEDHSQQPRTDSQEPTTTDPMLQRIMQFIEENIGNSDVGVGDMAEAAATSRSGLQRKLKQTMGVTPQELLSEARIKRACQMLRQTDKNISEVAYACGFNDPKYFSRCFKQSTGKTPKEWKNASNE